MTIMPININTGIPEPEKIDITDFLNQKNSTETNISTIDLSYETTDTLEEFTVELQVQWWEAYKGSSVSAGGEDIS